MSSPRFLVLGSAPAYGGRDECIGFHCHVLDVAYTEAWANRLANKFAGMWAGTDVEIEVRDLSPEPCQLGPAIADDMAMMGDDDLPF